MSWDFIELSKIVQELPCNYGDELNVNEITCNVVKVSNIDSNGLLYSNFEPRSYKKKDFEKLLCKKGELLVVKSSGSKSNILSGKTALVNDEKNLIASNFLMRLKVNDDLLDSKYLWYYLNSALAKKYVISIVGATTYPNLKWDLYSKMQIPLPPLATQKRIAEILDAADALRRKDQELLKKYDELAQAIFIDMFGDPVKNEKGWEVKTIGESTDFITSGSRGWAQYYTSKGDLFLRINNVGYNEIKLNDLAYVASPNNTESKRTKVKVGDILMSITADLGRTCVIPSDFPTAYINQHLSIIRLKPEYEPNFVSQVLVSDFGKNQLIKLTKGGVKSGLNFEDVKSLRFINPPIEMQNKFSEVLLLVREQVNVIKENVLKKNCLFNSLLQKAFKGELVA